MNKLILTVFFLFLAIFTAFSQDEPISIDTTAPEPSIITYNFINTNPQGASVFINDSLAGTTPFRSYSPFINGHIIRLSMAGFLDEFITITEDTTYIYKAIDLVSLKVVTPRPVPSFVLDDTPVFFPERRKVLPIAISAVILATASVMAYKFKQDANDRYDKYRDVTRDPEDLDASKRLDTFSGISLGVSLGALASTIYFLFFN